MYNDVYPPAKDCHNKTTTAADNKRLAPITHIYS